MDLKRIIRADEADLSPEGVTRFLSKFASTQTDADSRLGALEADPRDIITHAFELTKSQRALLDGTSDETLRADLQPVFDALREGKRLRVLSIQTFAADATLDEPVTRDQQQTQQARAQIVITIGRGRCKITITIDL